MKKSSHLIGGLVVAVASLVAVAGAQAQTTTTNSNNAYSLGAAGNSYVGLGVGRSDFKLGNGVGIFDNDEGDMSYNVQAGTYFNKNFGFEVGYTDFGKINRAGGRTKANGINLSLIGKLPLSNQFNLLGKVGTTYGNTDVSSAAGSGVASGSKSDFGLSYGIGAEYAFSQQWSGVLQYESHDLKFAGGNNERIGNTTVSARYRF